MPGGRAAHRSASAPAVGRGGGGGGRAGATNNASIVAAPTLPAAKGKKAVGGGGTAQQLFLPTKTRREQGGFRPSIVEQPDIEMREDDKSPAGRSHHSQAPSSASEGGGGEGVATDVPPVDLIDKLPFNLFVVAATLGNIFFLGLEMDFGPGPGATVADRLIWLMLEVLFYLCFTFELILRIRHSRGQFFMDVWNILDLILVGLALFDAFVLVPAGVGGQMRFFTVLRALRCVRLVRLVRMFPTFRELWLLVGGLVQSVKALGWVGLIVLMVLYVCSIVVTSEIGQKDDVYGTGPSYDGQVWPYKEYFGSVFKSMFTLFQVMTLDGWCDDIVRHVVYRQPIMGFFFIFFLFITAFGLMNIVIGIIVENTLAVAQISDRRVEEQKGEQKKAAVARLRDILTKSDSKRTGEISMAEMKAAYQSKIVQEQLAKIGLTLDDVQEIFRLLDYEQRGRVEVRRFADAVRELVGGAKRRDLAQVEVTVGALAQHLEHLDSQFTRIENDIGDLTHMTRHFVHNTVRVLTGFDGSVTVPPRPGSGSHRHADHASTLG